MDKTEIGQILENQKRFFVSGRTLDVNYRLENLKKLRNLILDHEEELIDALRKDFGKPAYEVLATESRFTLSELNFMIRKLRKWAGRQRVKNTLVNFPGKSYLIAQPYGQVLILSPWNYPFQLSIVPAMSALAAGNCVILRVSQKVPYTTDLISKILDHFPKELIALVRGEHSLGDYLLDYAFDYIFFTGSTQVGRKVMLKAAENLTPFTLELGGKNPCVVTADAKLDFAAKRIASGKFINAGQTCVAPDYILIDERVKDRFLELLINSLKSFYSENPEESRDYCRMVNILKTKRMESFIKNGNVLYGGNSNTENCYVEPTIITDVRPDDPIMQEEIFGPVLSVITYHDFSEIYTIINRNPKPLASYIFTGSRKLVNEFLSGTQSGSAVVNDTVMQVASVYLPFGGIGPSGTGRYHGRKSFETFSNMKSVLEKSTLYDIPVRYPPYTTFKEKVLKMLMR